MLTVEDVVCRYDTATVLDGLSMEVGEGEVLALMGRNGMGKTTLVRAISGIRPPQLVGGRIGYRGKDLTSMDSFEVSRQGLGYVPQGRHVFGSLTVSENLEVIARPPQNGQAAWTADRVFDFFPRLRERRASYARTLSGGEQQMLAIGRALMTNPTLLVMDEPSEGLAPIVLETIRDRLQELKGPDLSILLVEQNLGLAMSLADRMIVLGVNGSLVWEGTPTELDADHDAKTRHLGV